MPKYARMFLAFIVIAAPFSISSSAVFAGGIPAETLKQLKAGTVFVKVDFTLPGLGKKLPASGSGFVLTVKDEDIFIATNHHVVSAPKDIPKLTMVGQPRVVFHSGTAKEKEVTAEIIAVDSERDIAILRVAKFADAPKAVVLNSAIELTETTDVYGRQSLRCSL